MTPRGLAQRGAMSQQSLIRATARRIRALGSLHRVFLSRPERKSSHVPAELHRRNAMAALQVSRPVDFASRILLHGPRGRLVESFALECVSATTEDRSWLHTLLLM